MYEERVVTTDTREKSSAEKTATESGTFDWSMVGFLGALIVIAVVLGFLFT